jgi:hypothetical protein
MRWVEFAESEDIQKRCLSLTLTIMPPPEEGIPVVINSEVLRLHAPEAPDKLGA